MSIHSVHGCPQNIITVERYFKIFRTVFTTTVIAYHWVQNDKIRVLYTIIKNKLVNKATDLVFYRVIFIFITIKQFCFKQLIFVLNASVN